VTEHVAVYADWDDLEIDGAVGMLQAEGWEVRLIGSGDSKQVIAAAPDADALCIGYMPVTASVMDALPALKIIATSTAGYDSIDIEAASARGLWVANLPGLATEEVAVHALALMLALIRELPRFAAEVKAGTWSLVGQPPPSATTGLTLGLLGLGRIGGRVAELSAPLFTRILAHDPGVTQPPPGVELVERDELLAAAGVLSLHAPHQHGAPAALGVAELSALPRGALLVNTSRGGLVDSLALRDALDSGQISAAALDVFDVEPPPGNHPLVGHPRVLATPHAGFLSARTLRRYPEAQAENLLSWARTGRPVTPVAGPSA
jgi:phosphoglycerate dehydrogenase-like enzyme